MSILLYHYKQLTQCISEAELIEARLNSKNNEGSVKEKEEEKEQLPQPGVLSLRQFKLTEF
jgi:hypothetical protein